jgi:hypothetical protein
MSDMPKTVGDAMKRGYCITSRAHRIASRIDRRDWRDHSLVKDANWYRRCVSKDHITIPHGWLKSMPNSDAGPKDYVP